MVIQREEKPWGYELLLARTERYAGKILSIRAGERLSLQHHRRKDETLFLLEGSCLLELALSPRGTLRQPMASDESYRISPGRKHRLSAITDTRILEVSTPELDDVVRWADDYGRGLPQRNNPERQESG
jgi:mannose-6-phosphate isomerase